MKRRRPYPELIVAVASAAWGLFWIPLRAFQHQGLQPSWATLAQFLAPLLVLIPVTVYRLVRGLPSGAKQYQTGLLIGTAIALYLESLLLTQVARALILFYAMPAWGTILEISMLHLPFTRRRALALLLSLSGMIAILVSSAGTSASVNLGDGMALLSGIVFSFGAMRVRQSPETSVGEQVFAFFLYGFFAASILALLPLTAISQPVDTETVVRLAPWLLLVAICFLIPVMTGIYWGSRFIGPGRLGILLQIEAVIGIVSAALFSGEAFGLLQALGATGVICAGVVEVIGNHQAVYGAAESPVPISDAA